jgi:hypothetical protein
MNPEYLSYRELVRKRFAKDVQYARERGLSIEDMLRIICNVDVQKPEARVAELEGRLGSQYPQI